MELIVRLPQVDELTTKVDEMKAEFAALREAIQAIDKKLDDKAPAATASGPVAQPAAPVLQEQPKTQLPKPRRRLMGVVHADTKTVKSNGAREAAAEDAATLTASAEAEKQDEEALRARVEFEAKRTTRQFGIGGTRATIGRVADGVLRVDDVPPEQLAAVLSALQAL